jgi:hypothetical protein
LLTGWFGRSVKCVVVLQQCSSLNKILSVLLKLWRVASSCVWPEVGRWSVVPENLTYWFVSPEHSAAATADGTFLNVPPVKFSWILTWSCSLVHYSLRLVSTLVCVNLFTLLVCIIFLLQPECLYFVLILLIKFCPVLRIYKSWASIQWRLIFVGPQYGSCLLPPFWCLEICDGPAQYYLEFQWFRPRLYCVMWCNIV